MRTILTFTSAAVLLTAAAAGTALAGKPVASDANPFTGRYASSWSDTKLELQIDADGTLSGKLRVNTGGGLGGGLETNVRYTETYAGTVSDEGRMLATRTAFSTTSDWNGWVSLDESGDLVVLIDGSSSPFVVERR